MAVFECFDGDLLGTEYRSVRGFMRDNNLLSGDKVMFTGMINFADDLYFFYPKQYRIDKEADQFERARLLINCIRKYALNKGTPVAFGADEDNTKPVGVPPVSAIDLLTDYMRYGLYNNTETEIKRRNSGRVLWNKTIKSAIPFIRKDGFPVYTDLYVGRTNYAVDNDVTKIHGVIIARLDKMFGWYFLGRQDARVAKELTNTSLPYKTERCIALIRKELSAVYSDREIRLLRNLINILEEEKLSARHTSFLSGVCNFEHVWEEVCSEIYENQLDEIKDKVAYPAYVDEVGNIEKRSKHRMDIVISDESRQRWAIIDAKYYDFRSSPPGWHDLVKQFYYKRVLMAVDKGLKVENFFVAPGDSQKGMPYEAALFHNDSPFLSDEFTPIRIIYLNVEDVMRSYVDPYRKQDLRSQIFGCFDRAYITGKEGNKVS